MLVPSVLLALAAAQLSHASAPPADAKAPMLAAGAPRFNFTPASPIVIKDTQANTAFNLSLAAQPKGVVKAYIEAPNMAFSNCSFTFTPTNWNVSQQVLVTPLPYFSKGFQPVVNATIMTRANHTEDVPVFNATNTTLTLQREIALGATCEMFNDPHLRTFDGLQVDPMVEGCFNLMVSDDLVVQVNTVLYQPDPAKITLIRDVAVLYGGNVMYFSAVKGVTSADPEAVGKSGVTTALVGVPNTVGYNAIFTLSDGTKITVRNTMMNVSPVGDGMAAANVQIAVPAHYRNRTKGLCGRYDGDQSNDLAAPNGTQIALGPGKVWLPNADALANTWRCTPDLDLFACKNSCPGAPKAAPIPNSCECKIGTTLTLDLPPDYVVDVPVPAFTAPDAGAKASGGDAAQPTAPPPPPPPVDPDMKAKAEKICDEVFAKDDCKDPFLSQEFSLLQCKADCRAAQSLDFVESLRARYMERLSVVLKPLAEQKGTDAQGKALQRKAFDCRKKLGFGGDACFDDCNGNGKCEAGGCLCAPNYSGDDCSIFLPPPTHRCDVPKFLEAKMSPISYDNCTTYSGSPGIFDKEPTAKRAKKTRFHVCADRGPGTYCMAWRNDTNSPYNATATLVCTGKDDAEDNKVVMCPEEDYGGQTLCKVSDKKTGQGSCQAHFVPTEQDLKSYGRLPCDTFPETTQLAKGESRFYCIGANGSHLLQCPENKIS